MSSLQPDSFPLLGGLVGDVDHFANHCWGRRPLWRAGGSTVPSLRLDDVETMLDSSSRIPSVRIVRDGAPMPAEEWTRSLRLGGAELDDVVDGPAAVDAFRHGATIVLQGLHRTTPAFVAYARRLEDEICHPIQVNAYLTPPSSQGLAPHADRHDVLVVQMSGSKQWCVDGLGDRTMEPADVLYVPAGTRHVARSTASVSLHLTIGVHRRTLRHMVGDALRTAVRLDDPLPLGFRHAPRHELEATISAAFGTAASHLQQVDVGDAVRDLQRTVGRSGPAGSVAGGLTAVDRAAAVDRASRIALVAGCCIDGDEHGGSVTLDGWRLTVPAVAVAAIRRLGGGDPVEVGRLDDLDPVGQLVLARRLVRERLAVCIDPVEPGAPAH
ncbi:MAG: cupin domain-containing protein [Ilumatobacteraceae bacterium]